HTTPTPSPPPPPPPPPPNPAKNPPPPARPAEDGPTQRRPRPSANPLQGPHHRRADQRPGRPTSAAVPVSGQAPEEGADHTEQRYSCQDVKKEAASVAHEVSHQIREAHLYPPPT